MIILVDTSVWSLVLRRRTVPADNPWVRAFRGHVERGDGMVILGEVLQEILSGMKDPAAFWRLERTMADFPLLDMARGTYISAARLTNLCHGEGFQPGTVDVLVAAACVEYELPLLTADAHFLEIAKHCALVILPPLGRGVGAA